MGAAYSARIRLSAPWQKRARAVPRPVLCAAAAAAPALAGCVVTMLRLLRVPNAEQLVAGADEPADAAAKLEDQNDGEASDGGDVRVCALCLSAPRSHLLRPCNHLLACGACTERLLAAPERLCPVCRVHVADAARVFLA